MDDRSSLSEVFIHPDTNEKTRTRLLVVPILLHLVVTYHLNLSAGIAFNANIERGLSGTVDYLLVSTVVTAGLSCFTTYLSSFSTTIAPTLKLPRSRSKSRENLAANGSMWLSPHRQLQP